MNIQAILITKALPSASAIMEISEEDGETRQIKGGQWIDGTDPTAGFFLSFQPGLYTVTIPQHTFRHFAVGGVFHVYRPVNQPDSACVLQVS